MQALEAQTLPQESPDASFCYFIDVYMDDYIQLTMAKPQQQLEHFANVVLMAIHHIFHHVMRMTRPDISKILQLGWRLDLKKKY